MGHACASLANGLVSRLAKAKIRPRDKQDLMRKLFQKADQDLEEKLRQVSSFDPPFIVRRFSLQCL